MKKTTCEITGYQFPTREKNVGFMPLKDQVCSIELAKKLAELGVNKGSVGYFYHYNEPYKDGTDDWVITNWEDYETAYQDKSQPYTAYSAAELGEMLPTQIVIPNPSPEFSMEIGFRILIEKCLIHVKEKSEDDNLVFEPHYVINYYDRYQINKTLVLNRLFNSNLVSRNEADAKAMTLIELIERKFMTPEQIGQYSISSFIPREIESLAIEQ